MSTTHIIYKGNDMVLELRGLASEVTGDYLNYATVAVTLKDASGVEVSGESWPLAMAYVASSNGKYRATLADTLSLTDRARYTATITADAGAGLKGEWVEDLVCQLRKK